MTEGTASVEGSGSAAAAQVPPTPLAAKFKIGFMLLKLEGFNWDYLVNRLWFANYCDLRYSGPTVILNAFSIKYAGK